MGVLPLGPARALERVERYGFAIVLGLMLLPSLLGGPSIFGILLGPPMRFLTESIARLVS
jgi:hypothetical protein